jgi:hypothetical protein
MDLTKHRSSSSNALNVADGQEAADRIYRINSIADAVTRLYKVTAADNQAASYTLHCGRQFQSS